MNRIPRRKFLKHAAAAGCLSGRLAAASGRIAIVTGAPGGISSAEPVRWAAGELRRAVEEKGDSCVIVSSPGEAGDFQAVVMVALATGSPAESFRLVPEKISGKPAVRASASDSRVLVYAITELADRVRHATNPVAALTLAAALVEQPANRVRSIDRAFVSDVEDKSWFYDRDYWRDYLSARESGGARAIRRDAERRTDLPRGNTGGLHAVAVRASILLPSCAGWFDGIIPGIQRGLCKPAVFCRNAGMSRSHHRCGL